MSVLHPPPPPCSYIGSKIERMIESTNHVNRVSGSNCSYLSGTIQLIWIDRIFIRMAYTIVFCGMNVLLCTFSSISSTIIAVNTVNCDHRSVLRTVVHKSLLYYEVLYKLILLVDFRFVSSTDPHPHPQVASTNWYLEKKIWQSLVWRPPRSSVTF